MAHLLLSQCLRWLCIGLSTLSISLPDTRSRRSSTLIKQSASGGAVRDIMAVAVAVAVVMEVVMVGMVGIVGIVGGS